jgi:hypothetical protein
MKKMTRKFLAVPSYRNLCIGTVGALSTLAAGSSFAATADVATGASTAVADAQSQGQTVGIAVVGCVAALCVVGLVISLVRKV